MVEIEGSLRERRSDIRFPVSLAVRYGLDEPQVYQDFVLNVSKGGVYIVTDETLPEGSIIIMHFFIPPHQKLLAEFRGEVIAVNQTDLYPRGMHVEFFDVPEADMQQLEDFLEGKNPC